MKTNNRKFRIAVLASGKGSNAEEIFRYFEDHHSIKVALLLSNNEHAFALERARKFAIPTRVFTRSQFGGGEVMEWLKEYCVTHIVLAGFLWLIPAVILENYPDRIINIHPSLLPDFGGKGMFGMKVHETVKAAKKKETGITVHLINQHYDEGRILFQAKCELTKQDSAAEIAAKVNQLEHIHYPRVIEEWITAI